ncbi:MAG: hypothetical protein AB8B96_03595 [Lysobacterales bacterium]
MRRPGPGALIALALGMSCASGLALTLFSVLSLSITVTQVIIAALGIYCLILVGWVRPPAGRISGFLLTAAVTLAALLGSTYWGVLNGPGALAMLSWTWLIRCALLHRNLTALLGDSVLLATGVAAAVWAFESSGSIVLALWSFFLVQALLPWLPVAGKHRLQDPHSPQSQFDQANRRADQALRRLYARPQR